MFREEFQVVKHEEQGTEAWGRRENKVVVLRCDGNILRPRGKHEDGDDVSQCLPSSAWLLAPEKPDRVR